MQKRWSKGYKVIQNCLNSLCLLLDAIFPTRQWQGSKDGKKLPEEKQGKGDQRVKDKEARKDEGGAGSRKKVAYSSHCFCPHRLSCLVGLYMSWAFDYLTLPKNKYKWSTNKFETIYKNYLWFWVTLNDELNEMFVKGWNANNEDITTIRGGASGTFWLY